MQYAKNSYDNKLKILALSRNNILPLFKQNWGDSYLKGLYMEQLLNLFYLTAWVKAKYEILKPYLWESLMTCQQMK